MAQRVTISIVADASQADAVISKLNSSLGNIGGNAFKAQVDSVNKLSDGMLRAVQISDQLVRTGYRLTLGLSAPIIAAASYVVKLYSELEVARIAFTAFTGSVDLANQHLRNLYQFAITTPFNFSQVVQLSRYLQGVGFEAAQVIPLLRSVGNAVALLGGGNEEIERVVNQLVHIQTLSRVTLRELNPIARAGIPVFAELAEAIRRPGEAADETGRRLKNLIQKGLIPGPEFIKFFAAAQDVRFPQGLEKVSESIKISLSNLVDAAENAARVLGEAFAPAIKLIINVLTNAVGIITRIGTLFGGLPESIRTVAGVFIALLAVIGPLALGLGYLSRGITSAFQLFTTLTASLDANTAATVVATTAANAAAAAKLKEAEASVVLTSALKAESLAQASRVETTVAEQLPLFAAGPRVRNAAGQFIKEEKYVPPSQLAFGFGAPNFSPNAAGAIAQEAAAAEKLAAETALAAEKAAKGLGGLSGILGRVVGGILAFIGVSDLANVSLKSFGTAVIGVLGPMAQAVLTLAAIYSGVRILASALSDFPGFKQLNSALDDLEAHWANAWKYITSHKLSPEELIAKGGTVKDNPIAAKKLLDQRAKELRDSIELKQIEQNRITLLRDQLEVQRTAREYAIDSEGKELKGLQLINAEIDKRLYKATVQTHTNALTGLPENFKVPLTPIAAVDFAKGDFAQLQKFQEANREETLKKSQELDDEIFKNRISQLDDYTKDRLSRIEALNSSELTLVAASEVQKRDIQLASIEQVKNAELAHIDVVRLREIEATGQKIKDLGTESEARKAAQERAATYTDNPEIQKRIVDELLAYRSRAEAKLRADNKIADLQADEQRIVQTYNAARQEYEVKKAFAENYNKLAIELINKERDTALTSLTETIQFQKANLAQRRDAQLKNLEFTQPTSVRGELQQIKQAAAVRQDTLKQTYELEKIANATIADNRTSKDLEELKRRGANIAQLYERAKQLNTLTNQESLQQEIAYYQEVNNIQRESALQQVQVIRASTLSIFDSMRKASDTVLDQILTHSKSVFGAIGDAIKSAGITALKTIASAQISRIFTKLTTGQDVQFQASNVGTGPLAQFGNVLSRLGLGKPIVQPNAPSVPLIAATDQKIAQLQAEYAELVKRLPVLKEIPEPPKFPTEEIAGINKGISDTLEILRNTLGNESGIGYVELIDKSVPVIIQNLESVAKAFSPSQATAIKAAEDAAAKGDDDTTLLDKALQGKSINLPGTLGEVVKKIQEGIVKVENVKANPNFNGLNNPYALEYRGQTGASRSTVINSADNVPFAKFESLDASTAAVQKLILEDIGKNQTLFQIFSKYAPAQDSRNDPKSYAQQVAKEVGIGIDVPLQDFIKQFSQITSTVKSNIYVDTSPAALTPFTVGTPALITPPNIDKVLKDTIQNLTSPAPVLHDEKPNILSSALGELKEQIKEISNNPDAISAVTKTPIYFVPGHEKDTVAASYDKTHDVIRVYDDRDKATASLIHEDVHALLTKSHESIEALTNLLPVDTIKSAGDILKNRFDGYTTLLSRQEEIIPRLVSGQGATLGISQKQAESSLDTLVKALQDNGKSDLASKLVRLHQGAANVPYGTPLSSGPYGYPSLADVSGGILHDENPSSIPSSSTPTDSNIPAALSGVLGGAYGGIITGAAVGALAGVPRLIAPTGAEKVKQAVKAQYGVVLDSGTAKRVSDVVNTKYSGNVAYAIRQPDVLQSVQQYAVARGQVFGGRNNSLGFGATIGEKLKAAGPGLFAAGGSFLSLLGLKSNNTVASYQNLPILASGTALERTDIPGLEGSIFNDEKPSESITSFPVKSSGIFTSLGGSLFGGKGVGNIESGNTGFTGLGPLFGAPGGTAPFSSASSFGGILESGAIKGGLSGLKTGGLLGGLKGSLSGITGILSSLGNIGISTGAASLPIGIGGDTAATAAGIPGLGEAAPLSGIGGSSAIGGVAGGALLAGGGILLADGIHRGGFVGLGEDIAGGAAIGFKFGGPVGGLIGAAVGGAIGTVRLFIKGKPEQIVDQVKKTFGLSISKQFAKNPLLPIIEQNFGGSISVGIRSPQILQLLEMYAQATGQPFGIQNKVRASTLIQTQHGLTQQAILEGNKALSFSGVPVYGGIATTTIEAPGHYSTGGVLPYQGLPSGVFGSTTVPSSTQILPSSVNLAAPASPQSSGSSGGNIIVENKLPESAVGDYLDGRTVRTIQASPTAVSKAQISAYKNNVNRRESIRLQVNPGEILT